MNLLLDTHILLWWLDDPSRIPVNARTAIEDDAHEVYVSAVSAWEIAIKRGLGKLVAPSDLQDCVARSGFRELPITVSHALAVEFLPLRHRDPFDRLLIAQAIENNLTIVTHDDIFHSYQVAILPA